MTKTKTEKKENSLTAMAPRKPSRDPLSDAIRVLEKWPYSHGCGSVDIGVEFNDLFEHHLLTLALVHKARYILQDMIGMSSSDFHRDLANQTATEFLLMQANRSLGKSEETLRFLYDNGYPAHFDGRTMRQTFHLF